MLSTSTMNSTESGKKNLKLLVCPATTTCQKHDQDACRQDIWSWVRRDVATRQGWLIAETGVGRSSPVGYSTRVAHLRGFSVSVVVVVVLVASDIHGEQHTNVTATTRQSTTRNVAQAAVSISLARPVTATNEAIFIFLYPPSERSETGWYTLSLLCVCVCQSTYAIKTERSRGCAAWRMKIKL